MSVVFVQAPLRISMGGGGTDIPSYYADHGGFLVAGSLDKYVYVITHTSFQPRFKMKYSAFEEVEDPAQLEHPILREALTRYWDGDPLEIASVADVPAGTGLGSSGTYTVALLKSLALAGSRALPPDVLAERAAQIEIEFMGEPVGKQDQYAAAFGGVSAYTFNQDGSVDVEPLALSTETMEGLHTNLLLFYTGQTRAAGTILRDQVERSKGGDQDMLDNLHRTKTMGHTARELLEAGDLPAYAELLHEHWLNKRARTEGMANERIDTLYTLARRSGAIGGKLVGAGGGGFLLVYTPSPDDTRTAMAAAGATELRFGFDFQGVTGEVR